jgi:hypothetical protein
VPKRRWITTRRCVISHKSADVSASRRKPEITVTVNIMTSLAITGVSSAHNNRITSLAITGVSSAHNNRMTSLAITGVSSAHNNRMTKAKVLEFWYFQYKRRDFSPIVATASSCAASGAPSVFRTIQTYEVRL